MVFSRSLNLSIHKSFQFVLGTIQENANNLKFLLLERFYLGVVAVIFNCRWRDNFMVICLGAGELPDIEIKHADIIGPLAALAERDPTFARLLLNILGGAVYSLPLNGPDIRGEVRQGLEAALQRTNNGISFVGCVETLCLQDPEIWISPKVVGLASRKSTNYHSGILLLEKEILNETFPEPEPNLSAKRQKGRGGQVNRTLRPLEDAWVELAELYKALGENDIVLGLFKMQITKCEKTHKALEYQLEGNLVQALRLYDEAVSEYEDGKIISSSFSNTLIYELWIML